jgi:acyl-CoA reductase-like NAD-dependent aldehyde dehydrogenase
MTASVADPRIYDHFIAGAVVPGARGDRFESFDPARGTAWALAALGTEEDVDAAVGAAAEAFRGEWGALSPTRRGRLMMRFADALAERADEIAAIESRDNGKLLREMSAQLRVVPDWLYYYGGLADKIEGRVIPLDRTSVFNYTVREPLGVIGVITPWNSPILLTTMAVAPALAAGNTVVVKPSEITPVSLHEVARIASEAGIPAGVFNVVSGDRSTGEALVSHPKVAKVVFTGGVGGGRAVARTAADRGSSYLLELGGKSANIVFADAELDAAEAGIIAGIFAAGGQTCIAGSRAFVERPVYEEVVERVARRADAITVGDPLLPETQMGPLATKQQLERVESFVTEARDEGATVVAGGERAQLSDLPSGYFYRPTVVVDVEADSRIRREEIFGPVLTLTPFDDENEVVALANDSDYGLAAGVWTTQLKRAHRLGRRLEVGTVWINLYRAITFNSPFGGYKASGVGRENGIEAVDEFLQTKSVWCELGDEIQDPFVLRV